MTRWSLFLQTLSLLHHFLGLYSVLPCTVLLNGKPVYSCQMLVMQVGSRQVLTIEGLAIAEDLSPIQRAFLENDGAQCGYCTPGFVLSAKALLDTNPDPSDADIRQALAGNICRCNAYGRIIQSVREAARLLSKTETTTKG